MCKKRDIRPKVVQQPEPKKVRCCGCKCFQRDTSGASRNVTTGEYFMGLCQKLHADGVILYDPNGNPLGGRVFADKLRICNDYIPAIKSFMVNTPDGGCIETTVNMRDNNI